jgi:hypothetical protein
MGTAGLEPPPVELSLFDLTCHRVTRLIGLDKAEVAGSSPASPISKFAGI